MPSASGVVSVSSDSIRFHGRGGVPILAWKYDAIVQAPQLDLKIKVIHTIDVIIEMKR